MGLAEFKKGRSPVVLEEMGKGREVRGRKREIRVIRKA